MPPKTIQQQPVTIEHIRQVVFVNWGTAFDAITGYRPVDETGTPVGEERSYTEHFVGPNAQRVRDWLTAEIVPDINAAEGT
jgi:hypothetical protein